MTDEERWQIEGRTREDLRRTKQHVAALKIEIDSYAKKLEDASASLRHLLANPIGAGPTGMTSAQYALHFFRSAIPHDIDVKLNEFERESERLQKLEKQVGEFN
jgi:hypothetical protein